MSDVIKVAKFKTNVSFVGSDGVFHTGGDIVALPVEDFENQLDVCQLFNLPVPELIEEINSAVEGSVIDEVKKRARGSTAPYLKEEQSSDEEPSFSEVAADL